MSGIAAAGAFAGCGGSGDGGDGDGSGQRQSGDQTVPPMDSDGGDGGDGSDGSSGTPTETEDQGTPFTEILDRSYGINYANVQFNQVNLNPFSPNSDWGLRYQLQQTLAGANPNHDTSNTEYNPTEDPNLFFQAVDDLEFTENELRLHFKMPWVWSNGDSAGAEDWVIQFELDRFMIPEADRPDDPTVTNYRADGQETLVLELDPPYNKWGLVYDVITGYERLDTYRDGPLVQYHEAFQEATTEDEASSIRSQVVQHSEDMLVGEHPVSGPWMPVNATPSELQCELNEEHWAAATQGGPLNFRNLRFINIGDQSQKPAFENGTMDISGAQFPPGATYPDDVYPVTANEFGGQSFALNWTKDDYYADYRVRQGIAYVLDRAQIASNLGSRTNTAAARPLEKPIPAMLSSVARSYIPDVYEQMRTFDRDLDRAATLFEEAGLERDGGEWYKPNGDRFSIPMEAIQSTVSANETIAQNLSEFGIQSEVSVVDQTTQSQKLENNEWITNIITFGEFGFAPINFIPLFGPAVEGDDGPPAGEGNPPLTPEVPPIGEWDGEPAPVDTRDLLNRMARADTREENQEIVGQLAWAAHFIQANFPMYTNGSVTPVRLTDKWIYPHFNTDGGFVTDEDAIVWGLDSPEVRLIQGNGGGVRANPDWDGN